MTEPRDTHEALQSDTPLARVLRAIHDITSLLVRETELEGLIDRACEILTNQLDYRSAWIILVDGEPPRAGRCAFSGIESDFAILTRRLEAGEFPECLSRGLEAEATVIIASPRDACSDCPGGHDFTKETRLVRRLEAGGRVLGILAASVTPGVAERPDDLELFEHLAGDIGLALGRIADQARQHRQQEFTERLMATSLAGIVHLDASGMLTYANPKGLRLLGLDVGDLAGRAFDDSAWKITDLDGGPLPREQLPFEMVRRTGLPVFRQELAIEWPDGRRVLLSANAAPLHDGSGAFDGAVFSLQDITELHARRRELETERRRLKLLFDSMELAFALHEIVRDKSGRPCDYRFLEVNPAFERMTGLRAADILGRRVREVIPDVEEIWIERYGQVVDTGRSERFENYSSPLKRHYYISAYRPQPEQFAVTFLDVTERREAIARLAESERRLKTLMGNLPGMAYRCRMDHDWTMEFVSEGAAALTGYNASELQGNAEKSFASLIHPDDRQQVWDNIVAAIAAHRLFTLEYRLEGADGRLRWVWERGCGVFDADGKLECLEGFIEDITERKKSEAQRETLQAQLLHAQKMEAVGRLAGGVAHDFNNMLQSILGYADLLLSDARLEAEAREQAGQIRRAATRSAELTRQLLGFARRQTISPRVVDINEVVAGMLKMLGRLISEEIELLWLPVKQVCPVRVDPAQIEQVLANLVVNSRDAIDAVGSITIETAQVSFDEDYCRTHQGFLPGRYAALAVSDDGCGMDAETVERIFEPFYTTKPQEKGTGLGLATVYGMVRQNGGFVNVYSEPDVGTTMRLYFPLAQGPLEKESAGSAKGEAEIVGGSETILLTEDDPAILALGRRMLERLGYTVLLAASPAEAMALVRSGGDSVRLLLTDVVMPGMTGRDLFEHLRTLLPQLKCLYMSGYTANVIAHRGVLDEGVHFIQKPFSAEQLAAAVRRALES